MKKTVLKYVASATLLFSAVVVNAANELAVHIVKDGKPGFGLTAKIDGTKEKSVSNSGLVFFDLSEGAHSVQILSGEETLHSLRFSAASGQLADITIVINEGNEPKVSIENYFKTESVSQKSNAASGGIVGRVSSNGIPLMGATVNVVGTNIEEETDMSGAYQIELPRGIYQLKINHPDFGTKEVSDYRVISNVTKNSNFTISTSVNTVEEVVVLAKMDTSAFQESERYSTNVIETMGIEQLARFGDSDVAASIIRVPSVTVQGSKFVFIRGLGGRYITTTLNGSTMPSTNPSRRTVPLDLFPSNIVEQLDVKKTFIASMPGESTGGNLVINTRTFPDEASGKVSFSLGYVDGLTGDEALVDPQGGNFDVLGWDDGERGEPGIVTAIADALNYSDFYSQSAKNELGRIAALELKDDFDLETENANPDISLGLNYGDLLYLDRLDAELGYFAAANYKNEWNKKSDGITRTYSGENASVVEDDFNFEEYSNAIEASSLLSFGLNIGNSTYQSNTVISRVSEETVNYRDGFDGDALEESIRWSIEWEERQFISQQFTGEHILGEEDEWSVEWQFTGSQAKRYAPDRREVRFNLIDGNDAYDLEVPNLVRQYDDLVDDNLDFSTDVEYIIGSSDLDSALSFGLQLISRDRDSDSVSYGFNGSLLATDDSSPNLSVSEVINSDTITGDFNTGYTFQDKTLPSDSYEAEMDLNSFYASYDLLWDYVYQVVLGARYEDFYMDIDTFDIQTGDPVNTEELDEQDILPSLSVNWYYNEDEQIRFALSKTKSRPDFKERANATFYDDECDCRIRGNPNLQTSEVFNADLRWEKYWSEEDSVSVALFYKEFDDAIERVAQDASGTAGNTRTFENADSADMIGIEVDATKNFPFNKALTKNSFVSINASWIDSEVDVQNGETRKLQGQPDYTFNLIVGYDDIENGHEVTLLFNQNGETIFDVGVNAQPNVITEPRLDVNLNYKYSLSDEVTIKAKLTNLLDSEVEQTQGGNVFRSYKKGMEFQAGIDWKF